MRVLVVSLVLAIGSCATPAVTNVYGTGTGTSASVADSMSLDPFYEPLAPYGDWWWSDRYGWVFSPSVGPGWRPYTFGHWVFSNDGWLWASDEPFGWATFHYGRWVWLDDSGWIWIPGRVWAPAWVTWRSGPGFYGWAPYGFDSGPFGWVFVDDRAFIAPSIVTVAVPPEHNRSVLSSTRVIHRPERASVERATGVSVPVRRIADDPRRARPGDVVVPRARAVEREGGPDLPGRRARFSPGDDVVRRPLAAPSDDEIDRRFARRPQDAAEQSQLDEQRAREKRAADGRRSVPRQVAKGKPKHR